MLGRRRAALTGCLRFVVAAMMLLPVGLARARVNAGLPSVPFSVSAHDASGVVVGFFDVRGRPGASLTAGRLVLTNRTDKTIVVLLDPVNALTAIGFGSTYALRGTSPQAPATWTRLSSRRVALGPRQTNAVGVSETVAPGTATGQYLSGVAIQAQEATKQRLRSNVAVSSVVRYAVGLQTTVPGPRHPRILLTGASLGRQPAGLTFMVAAANPSDEIERNVSALIHVTQGSRVVAQRSFGPGTFVSGTSVTLPVTAPGEQPAEGAVYRLDASLVYGRTTVHLTRRLVFGHRAAVVQQQFGGRPAGGGSGPPWLLIAAAVLAGAILGAAALATVLARRSRRESI